MANEITCTLDERAYKKFTRLAKQGNVSKAELVRQVCEAALGMKIESAGNAFYQGFSDGEVSLIMKRYKQDGPTQLSKELSRQFGTERRPSTVSNKAKSLGLVYNSGYKKREKASAQ